MKFDIWYTMCNYYYAPPTLSISVYNCLYSVFDTVHDVWDFGQCLFLSPSLFQSVCLTVFASFLSVCPSLSACFFLTAFLRLSFSMSFSICVSLSVYHYLYIWQSVWCLRFRTGLFLSPSLSQSVCLTVSEWLSFMSHYLPLSCLSIDLCLSLSVCFFLFFFLRLSVSVFHSLSVSFSLYVRVALSVYLSV